MPLGIISDDEFLNELRDLKIIRDDGRTDDAEVHIGEVIDIERGRGNKLEVPEEIRKLAAENVLLGIGTKEVAKALNLSTASVSAYKNGATSTASYNQPNNELKKHTNEVRARITRKANKKLITALDCITPELLADSKARDLAAIAKDMSAVIKNIEPAKEVDDKDKPQFVIYAPQLRQEIDYQLIHVNE